MIGLISDTHGLLREEVVYNLSNCNLIIHTGDIGKIEVIEGLEKIAKVEFIRGNCDKDKSIAKEEKIIDIYNIRIYLVHDISKVNIDLKEENIDIVVYGHSHKSNIYEDKGILYINPGSVGPRRFNLPISMAKLKRLDNERCYDSLELIDKNIYRYKYNIYIYSNINIIFIYWKGMFMFGYVKINKMDLTFREYEHYRGYYCGLCKYLKDNHGEISRLSLNYDITFLILVLTAVYRPKSTIIEEGCITNPFKKKKKIINEITEYAASMNVLLTYYKLEDNLKDDNGLKDKVAYTIYKGRLKSAYEKYPKKAEFIKGQLETLYNLEQENNTNIDLVSNTFGNLMAEIFAYKEDEFEKDLRQIGFNIGKYIYLLDAYEDLDKDYKKGRYNPFIEYIDRREELKLRVDKLISMSLGMLGKRIDNLNLKTNTAIIENIVYSGVYLRYQNILEEGVK